MPDRPHAIAPVWHTLAMLALLAALSWMAVSVGMASGNAKLHHLPLYSIVIVGEWVTFAFALWGSDATFATFVGRVIREPRTLGWDILTAVLIGGVLLLITPVIVRLMGPSGWVSTKGMLPRNSVEVGVWVVMATSAGICEETVFRGYLQQQVAGWTGLASAGIVVQAIIFGAAHAYQGFKNVSLICIWGLVFGLAAWLRRGLRGNMIAHAVIDVLSILS
ncbi:MAG TPA: CPBP family intramembrane glutamic endopeptidase [Gemmatimonadaceae bacterium]|nr:CPBP family intramembrane glutamic endopeptidase [Gemmatimonadaceae bacterium]